MRAQTETAVSTAPQTKSPFAFSHPLVYAIRAQDRVEALDAFIRDELYPKLSRLREEHTCIENQIQRTTTKTNDSVEKPIETKAKRLKQQAWMWKRTSKRQELNRFEPFFELATDLRRISKDLNPNLLRLTALWQRSQSIAPRKHLAADDDKGVVYNQTVIGKKRDRRRQREQQRLSREYHNALMENAKLSKSIQKQTDKLKMNKDPSSNSTEDTSILSSLMLFSGHYIACGTCDAMFHKDYFNALVVHYQSVSGTTTHDSRKNLTYICIHCWNLKAQGDKKIQSINVASPLPQNKDDNQANEEKLKSTMPIPEIANKKTPLHETKRWKARKLVIKNRMIAATASSNEERLHAENDSSMGTQATQGQNIEKIKVSVVSTTSVGSSAVDHQFGSTSSDRGSPPSETISSTDTKNAQDSKNKASKASTTFSMPSDQRCLHADNRSSTESIHQESKNETSTASATVDHYIDSMSALDNGLIRIGESLSSCSNLILGDSNHNDLRYNLPPLLQPHPHSAKSTRQRNIDLVKLQTKGPTIIDNYYTDQTEEDTSERSEAWSRCGSSTSSLCTNSIVERDPGDSLRSRNSIDMNSVRYTMDGAVRADKTPLKRSDSWNRNGSSDSSVSSGSIFSDFSTETSKFSYHSAASSSEQLRPKYIKSAMKKTAVASKAPKKGTSPTKVQDFPSAQLSKSVRFQSPLAECRVFDPLVDPHSGKALLDTSTEIMDQLEYFCKWDTFMNAFEQK